MSPRPGPVVAAVTAAVVVVVAGAGRLPLAPAGALAGAPPAPSSPHEPAAHGPGAHEPVSKSVQAPTDARLERSAAPGAEATIPPRPERSRVTFLGWSPDGRYVVYRRQRWRRPRYPGARVRYRDRTLHREVRAAKLRGYGPPLRADPAAYLATHGYVRRPLPRAVAGPNAFDFRDAPDREPLRLAMISGARLAWRVTRGERALTTRPFDRLYVAMDAQAFLSPTGDTLAVVLTLDTGWRVDAALYLVPLGGP